MIVGIGTDLVHIPRIQNMIDRYGDRASQRILGDTERAILQASTQQAAFLAKRFAAKEATVKALGTGFSGGINFRDIVVTNNKQGQPVLHFFGQAQNQAHTLHVDRAMISLSDDGEYALAYVTLVSK